ncbi:MAG: TdeIII family type II restriction endonuclease [Melioribacteraceae bacterium]|nr:restriction endonuclease [Ignavibacteriota bacterium]MBZ0180986.1 TdeIII family type II restriction endonuclease [Melioribacteraceae bacterium]
MSKIIVEATASIINELMEKILNKVLYEDPFNRDEHRAKKPLYAALVPDEIFKGSHFERRFVTPFGGVWEKLAVTSAKVGLGEAYKGYTITGQVRQERQKRIQEVLNRLEHKEKGKERIKPNWESEIKYILEGKGELIPTTVVCDVYAKNIKTGSAYAFELKAPLPNSDQTKVSKEKIFKLLSMEEPQVNNAFFVLPYNPYGKKEDYNWSFPKRWFDMQNDPVVLIGNEFWDFLGGSGTYNLFIKEVNKLGKVYRDRIYREYLGLEPPLVDDFNLV